MIEAENLSKRYGEKTRVTPATARPYLLGALASLSAAAAAIHFAVVFEHFKDYTLYGVFFLVLAVAGVTRVFSPYRLLRFSASIIACSLDRYRR